jgi:hypothetical protein
MSENNAFDEYYAQQVEAQIEANNAAVWWECPEHKWTWETGEKCELCAARDTEHERIIKLLRHWDTETIAADYELEDSRILDEMRRAYDIGYEYGAEDNR